MCHCLVTSWLWWISLRCLNYSNCSEAEPLEIVMELLSVLDIFFEGLQCFREGVLPNLTLSISDTSSISNVGFWSQFWWSNQMKHNKCFVCACQAVLRSTWWSLAPEIKTWRTPRTGAQGGDSVAKLIDFNEFHCHFDWFESNLLEKNNLPCCLVHNSILLISFPISSGSKQNMFFNFITWNKEILPLVFCFHPDAGQSQHNCCLANS